MGTVTVRDQNGRALGVAYSSVDPTGQGVALDRIMSGKGRLLGYYFGEGSRAVELESGDFRLRGMLRTTWQDGERRWRVQLQPVTGGAGGFLNGDNALGRIEAVGE